MFGRWFTFACFLVFCLGLILAPGATPQSGKSEPASDAASSPSRGLEDSLKFAEESLKKNVDDLMLFRRLEDIAVVDKVRYTGPPPRVIKNPTGHEPGNPVLLFPYT